MYFNGQGVPQDDAEAVRWWRLAADQGIAQAQSNLILAALAEFERGRIQERVRAGLARARRQGTQLGRPIVPVPCDRVASVAGMSVTEGAAEVAVSRSTLKRWRREVGHKTLPATA